MDLEKYKTAKRRLAQASAVLLSLLITVLFISIDEGNKSVVVIDNESTDTKSVQVEDSFSTLSLDAKSVYVYDVAKNKVLFEKNSKAQLPLASVTKLMTVLTASEIVPNNMLVSVTAQNILPQGDSGLLVGEKWNLRKLINFALIVSSNDAMNTIASVAGAELTQVPNRTPEDLFINQMNNTAHKIGLTQTYYVNESGLDVSNMTSGGYGSAHDMAKLIEYIIENKPTLLEATQYSDLLVSSEQKVHKAENTNKIIGTIPSVIASKTGLTDLSGGNLVVAFDAGIMRPIIISILGSTEDGRFTDMQQLVEASLKSINSEAK